MMPTTEKSRPEISWSLMHPTRPDAAYMRRVITEASRYHVDSFEICGEAHSSTGGMDGAIFFRDYPEATRHVDRDAIQKTIDNLREVTELAHQSKRPVYYWHREVMVPQPVVESIDGLLDEDGEFNLFGAAYHDLLRAKLREFFDNVPEMDGIVLTVTESNYSVIHNSNPDRYPPAKVIKEMITTLAGELKRLNRRFILRSFGSIAQDYEDILEGARLAGSDFDFEIETKITPYDFSPFLPLNPYLKKTGSFALSAEYDSIGEFLGAGYLPAAHPERVLECVNHATLVGVDRHVIRIDRIGHPTFSSGQAIHLMAFDRAIRFPGTTPDIVWKEWAAHYWPTCSAQIIALMQRSIEMVRRTHFIDGHVIFHAFPIDPSLKWIKACGILSAFKPRVDLSAHQGMWGILPRISPERAAILEEKESAVRIADEGLAELRGLQSQLSSQEFERLESLWKNATSVTRVIRDWCRCICAYLDDMENLRADHPTLSQTVRDILPDFERIIGASLPLDTKSGATAAQKTPANEYGDYDHGGDCIEDAYARPIWKIILSLFAEYRAEIEERLRWNSLPGLCDAIICGSITDDHRVQRYMHASHAMLIDGRPARAAGNRVFPNGFIQCDLSCPAAPGGVLIVQGAFSKSRGLRLIVNGETRDVEYTADGTYTCALPEGRKAVTVRIQKTGAEYPWIHGLATASQPV